MLQGAIAYYRATGDPTLLNAGIRFDGARAVALKCGRKSEVIILTVY
jgi:hypothetical protein